MKKIALLALVLMVSTLVPAVFAPPEPRVFCIMVGRITSFGGQPAAGWLHSISNVTGQHARVRAHFVPHKNLTLPPPPPPPPPPLKNITFSFYALRLENTSMVALNYSGYNYYISGLWDVYNVTFIYYCNETYMVKAWIVELLINDSPGELYVTNHWMNFTVSITGFDLVEGIVKLVKIRIIKPFPIADVNLDCKVNIIDLVVVAGKFGHTPGTPLFDFKADINCDYCINILDLVKTAKDFGNDY